MKISGVSAYSTKPIALEQDGIHRSASSSKSAGPAATVTLSAAAKAHLDSADKGARLSAPGTQILKGKASTGLSAPGTQILKEAPDAGLSAPGTQILKEERAVGLSAPGTQILRVAPEEHNILDKAR